MLGIYQQQDQIGLMDGLPASLDPDFFNGIVRVAQACCVNDMQGNSPDLDGAAQGIPGGAGDGGHDGQLIPG